MGEIMHSYLSQLFQGVPDEKKGRNNPIEKFSF
jgi:hypothetical protein